MTDHTLESAWRSEVHKLWKEIELIRQNARPLPEINCNFGEALIHLKAGKRLTRKCWRNKAVFLYLWDGAAIQNENGQLPEIRVKTVDKLTAPWMPNHTELLAEDWMVIE